MKRRALLQWTLAAASSPMWRPFERAAAAPVPLPPPLEPGSEATFRALAATVLPDSMGPERLNDVADAFLAWIRAYREGADLDHGYGHTYLKAAGPSPAAQYSSQLRSLEHSALGLGASFAATAPERRRALVEDALAAAKLESLPERPDGRHVAADLMAFFFNSSEANDLCYRAAIGRDTCRGLVDSDQAPDRLSKEQE